MTAGIIRNKNPKQEKWDSHFLKEAELAGSMSTCNRLNAGAVIVRERRYISGGYNGSMVGADHCDDEGHLIYKGHCIRTVHAEANAIAQAAKFGISIKGATMYVTHTCCYDCFKLAVNAGITKFVFGKHYENTKYNYFDEARDLGIIIKQPPKSLPVGVDPDDYRR